MDHQRLIGQGNSLPWHLPADLARFKKLTMGKPVLMGRLTHESIGKPLPGRQNIVLSRNADYHPEGCLVARSFSQALAQVDPAKEVVVIGGAALFSRALTVAQRFYLTVIHNRFQGDVFFPPFTLENWEVLDVEHLPADKKNPWSHSNYLLFSRERTGDEGDSQEAVLKGLPDSLRVFPQ
jgi:dihydrofolate reductase